MAAGGFAVHPQEPGRSGVESKGLKGGALGLVSSLVVGMASTGGRGQSDDWNSSRSLHSATDFVQDCAVELGMR
jgi:hypothetical protein